MSEHLFRYFLLGRLGSIPNPITLSNQELAAAALGARHRDEDIWPIDMVARQVDRVVCAPPTPPAVPVVVEGYGPLPARLSLEVRLGKGMLRDLHTKEEREIHIPPTSDMESCRDVEYVAAMRRWPQPPTIVSNAQLTSGQLALLPPGWDAGGRSVTRALTALGLERRQATTPDQLSPLALVHSADVARKTLRCVVAKEIRRSMDSADPGEVGEGIIRELERNEIILEADPLGFVRFADVSTDYDVVERASGAVIARVRQ